MHNVYVRHHAYLLVTYCNKNKGWFWVLGGWVLCTIFFPCSFSGFACNCIALTFPIFWCGLMVDGS